VKSLKFLSRKEMNKMAKSTLALVIAGAFTFSGTAAFASEKSEEADFETVELKNAQSAEAIAETNKDAADDAKEKLNEIESETPSLLPGSFFYFAKLALEKVKLALTFDDVKEAKLLAGYAAERMAEAEALFAEGKEEEALTAIERALEQMENAETIADDANEDSEQPKSEDENTGDLISEDKSAEDESSEEDVQAEDVAADESSSGNDTGDKETEEEVKEILAQNIIALKSNLAKFSARFDENHPAILAMQKNIDKFTEKWSGQLIGLEKEAAEEPSPVKSEEAFSEMESADDSAKEIDESVSKEEAVTPAVPVKVSKETKDAAKAEKKKAHEEAKVLEAQKRAEAKAAREEARKAAKEAHEAAKQAERELRKAAGKAAKEQQEKKVQEKQAEAKSSASKGKERAEQARGQGKENKGN
jgi:Domain of unknown function (DUF5667)